MTLNKHDDEHLNHGGRERLLKLLAIWKPPFRQQGRAACRSSRACNAGQLDAALRGGPRWGLTEESADALSLWLDKMALQLVTHGMVLDGVLEMTYRESAPNAAGVSHLEYVYLPVGTSGEPSPS
jgi:hypothetical protein